MSSRSSSNAGGSRRSGRSSPLCDVEAYWGSLDGPEPAHDDGYHKLNNSYSPSSVSSTSTPSQAEPGEAIQFSQLSAGGANGGSLSPKSRQSSASPTPGQIIPQHGVQSRGGGIQWPPDRNYSFLASHPSITGLEPAVPKENNERLAQLKKRKESKEKKKERNVKSSFVSGGPEDFDIDKFLESIGEKVDKKKKSGKDKKELGGADKSGQTKAKNRKVTATEPNESSVKAESKGSSKKKEKDPEVIESTTPAPAPISKAEDDSHKVQDVGKYRNAVVVQADLTDNLTADTFTKVTSKKQKWKKKSSDELATTTAAASTMTNNSQPRPNSSSSSSNRSRNNFNVNRSMSRPKEGQQQNFRNNHPSPLVGSDSKKETAKTSSATSPSSSTSSAPETAIMSGDLDLVADFPPLDLRGGTNASTSVPATSATTTAPSESSTVSGGAPRAWSSLGHPTNNIPQPSDLSAVIHDTKNKASDKKANPSSSAINNVPSSVESSAEAQSVNGGSTSNNSYSSALMANRFSSHNLDDKNIERAYNPEVQQQQGQPAVTMCGQGGEDPVDDWSTNGGFEFGGPVNEDLVSMGTMPPQRPEGDETLCHMDDAIVSYGERVDENQHINAVGGGELIWKHKQHNSVVVVNGNGNSNEDEEGEGVGGSESWPSGRTTPEGRPLPSAPSAVDATNRPSKQSDPALNLNFNYEDIVAFVRNEWLQVTKMHNVEYYTPSNNTNSNNRNRTQGHQKNKN